MHVLITGGTGFVGRELVKQLLAAKNKVTLFSRRELPAQKGVVMVTGALNNSVALDSAMRNVDAVIHLAAVIAPKNRAEFKQINVTGTQQIIDACERNKVARLIFMSSYVADPEFTTHYGKSKNRAEKCVKASKLDWTILRPTAIYGEGKNSLTPLINLVRRSPIVPAIYGVMQPVALIDVVDAIIKTLSSPVSVRKTYNLAGDLTLSCAEFCRRIAKMLGLKRIILPLPACFSSIFSKPISLFAPGLGASMVHLLKAKKISTELTRRELGWKPHHLEEQFSK